MFTDYLDIGIMVEDRQAGRIATAAIENGYTPTFQNACGPYLELQFVPPSIDAEGGGGNVDNGGDGGDAVATTAAAAGGASGDEKAKLVSSSHSEGGRLPPLLHGWMEQVPTDDLIHLLRPTVPTPGNSSSSSGGARTDGGSVAGEGPKERVKSPSSSPRGAVWQPSAAPATETVVVSGQITHILHLWSTLHTARAAAPPPPSATTADGNETLADAERKRREEDDEGRFFNGRGDSVLLTDPVERELALRDDTRTVRAALDAVVTLGRALKERPSAQVSHHVDSRDGSAVLLFR